MPFSVVYDACVLHPAPLRDLLMRIARTGIVQARWSESILDECFSSIRRARPDLDPENLARTRALMQAALPAANVHDFEPLIDGIALPDPGDRHVLAAAIRSGAQAIVTFNTKDFPSSALGRYDVEAKHPDDFVMDCLDLAPVLVANCVREQAAALRNPAQSVGGVLTALRDGGLVQSVARLNELLGELPSASAPLA
ncbi:MAG: hypothetical protein ABS52_15440 [Gemmatimonadetes bacterium SCN 70-22]|nr:MAG: hypothetical protein ABS52_15440 [Gemmatimonadetes bacterium SCN 70-22]